MWPKGAELVSAVEEFDHKYQMSASMSPVNATLNVQQRNYSGVMRACRLVGKGDVYLKYVLSGP